MNAISHMALAFITSDRQFISVRETAQRYKLIRMTFRIPP